MTTAGPPAQAERTVSAEGTQVLPLGQQAGQARPAAVVPGLGNVVATTCNAGASPAQTLLLTVAGLHLTTNTPAVVLVQTRQGVNQNLGYSDTFAVQVISTSTTQIVVQIRRIDTNTGWGQNLRLDMLIVDSVA